MPKRLANLKTERANAGLSIAALATATNTTDMLVMETEDGGVVDNHIAQRFADALGVSLSTLGEQLLG